MRKEVLSEIAVIQGEVKLPKGYEINQDVIIKDITEQYLFKKDFQFSKEWDRLNKYIIEYMNLNNFGVIVDMNTWGSIYLPNQGSQPLKEVDENNFRDSPYFTMLYGVKILDDSCDIKIYYDDIKFKQKEYNFKLKTNHFILFPSTLSYYILPNNKTEKNYIQTITYDLRK